MVNLSGNSISRVWRDGEWVYKRQPKYLAENEFWCFKKVRDWSRNNAPSPIFVPKVERVDEETIRSRFIESIPITDVVEFAVNCATFLIALQEVGIRHGDLTIYSVIPFHNIPFVIDWAESRLSYDPRPDKRTEGDRYWMMKTMKELINESA